MFAVSRKVLVLVTLALLPLGANAQSRLLGGPPKSAAANVTQGAISNSLGIAYPQYLWPKVNGIATVYYNIDAASDPNATPKIMAAISTFNADFSGVIHWVLWNSSLGLNYVDINLSADDTSGVCEADEGYEAVPAQAMGGSTDCTVGTILHEMGHIIGLWHEHQRADRDTYVTVNYGNVIKGSWGNFVILADDVQILGAYDYASVMQYIPYAFSRNGGSVIESSPAGIPMAGYEGVPSIACPPGQTCAPGTPALPLFDYSAGDKETILRLYGAPPTGVTVTSNPVGLTVVVDGVSVVTPQTYVWPLYSTHTLGVQTDVQTLSGYILNSSPPAPAIFYYTYGRWSDSTAQNHSITVIPGNGSPIFPNTSPAVATYSANFVQLVPYAATVSVVNGQVPGQVAVSPQPQVYPGATGAFFVARQEATLTATPNAGWNFYEFNNAPYWLPGGLGANPKSFYVPDTGNPVNTTVEFSDTPVYTVDVTPETFSSGTWVYVDSDFAYTPKNFSQSYDSTWTPGSGHKLDFPSPEYPYSYNSRFNFASWSDGGAATHRIASLPGTSTSYIATVTPQFQPATYVDFPPCGGSNAITPASTNAGFYPTGKTLTFTATPDASWVFAGWTYDLTGLTNPKKLTADDETLVVANFNTTDVPLTLTSTAPSSAAAGGAAFTLTLNGTGFTRTSLVSANGQYRTVTYKNPTKLTVPMTAADIAAPGGFQVFVENYPTGWTGCAVFGYQTFLVTGAGPPLPPPVFSPAAGTYTAGQSVTLTDALPSATIYYTTDGSTPTASSPVYSGAISVSATETLKAIAEEAGYVKSTVARALYTIN